MTEPNAEKRPVIAIPSFPGSNGDVDNLRVLRRCGFDAFLFRWNDSLEKLADVDGYFLGAGFSYEDRGRSGMVAARDPLFRFMHEESQRGKVIVGNCNGAQVLVESGLIPLGETLRMSLAHNAIRSSDGWTSPGFLNTWVWITPVCNRARCATSDWQGPMHIPIAHGEGRFVTKDLDVIAALKEQGQIAFKYCDASGVPSTDPSVTPNGSMEAIAGICNPQGNVVALMPHPERTALGDPYFHSMREWIQQKKQWNSPPKAVQSSGKHALRPRDAMHDEIFIDTIITNNEERTVEQAAKRVVPALKLKQYRYIGLRESRHSDVLSNLSVFNPHKEVAYVRSNKQFRRWNAEEKTLDTLEHTVLQGVTVLRRDEPDTGAGAFGSGSETGICYDCRNVVEADITPATLEVFGNPHASTLYRLT